MSEKVFRIEGLLLPALCVVVFALIISTTLYLTQEPSTSESENQVGESYTLEGGMCSDADRAVSMCPEESAPVCGLVMVQCITEPCPPIPETFSNACTACAQGNVREYTNGACIPD